MQVASSCGRGHDGASTLGESRTPVQRTLLFGVALAAALALASDYVDGWGPAIGSTVDALELSDSAGTARTSDQLMGENGLLVFFNRSADW